MFVSRNWLNEFVDIHDISEEELEHEIIKKMIEIESVHKMVDATGLTTGYVLDCVNHPDSDHLHVLQMDLGDNKVTQIVCGAPNIAKGQHVIVATCGAVLPGDFRIKASKIRGVESFGMVCALQELGIEEKYVPAKYKEGIYVLPETAVPGTNPLEYLCADDTVIELSLTPNRADLLSYLGVGYDLAAVLDRPMIKKYDLGYPKSTQKNPMKVTVETEYCKKYCCRVIRNCQIKESPMWMKERLIASGIRPINNLVDITNYVLLELGQPLHSFDFDTFGSTEILVRTAQDQEKMMTLDNQERTLTTSDIVVTNGTKIMAVGGVMGGLDSEITENTKTVLLEAAYFDASHVRKTSKRLGLRSESSVRFERMVDPARVEMALEYACKLYTELADASVDEDMVSAGSVDVKDKAIAHSVSQVNQALGTNLSMEEIQKIFDRLGFKSTKENEDDLVVYVPTRRVDIENYQDLNEEVARIYGFDQIPTVLPVAQNVGKLSLKQQRVRNIKHWANGLGLTEAITYSLESKEEVFDFVENKEPLVEVVWPLSEDRRVARQSLLNGLLEAVKYNQARKVENIAFFEIGRRYTFDHEDLLFSGAITGKMSQSFWKKTSTEVDYFLAKGMLEDIFEHLNVMGSIAFVPYEGTCPNFHPYKTATIKYKGYPIGVVGSLHPKYEQTHDVKDVIVFEVNLETILQEPEFNTVFRPLNRYPSISRDICLVVDKVVSAGELEKTIKEVGKKMLTGIKVFDLFQDEKLGHNKKSIAFTLTFEDYEKTLESQEVDKKISQILKRLEMLYGAHLR